MKPCRKDKMKYTVTIDFTPGSEFQGQSWFSTLQLFIQAWEEQCKNAHKKNRVKITKQMTTDVVKFPEREKGSL